MARPQWKISTWIYYAGVTTTGWLLLAHHILDWSKLWEPDPWWPILLLALIALRRTYIQLPNCDGRILPSGAVVLYAAVGWGAAPAAILAALEARINSVDQSAEHAWRLAFNVGALVLAISSAAWLGALVLPVGDPEPAMTTMSRALLVAVVYWLVNVGSVLGILFMVAGRKAVSAARSAMLWSWVEYGVGGVAAGGLSLLEGRVTLGVVLMSVVIQLTKLALTHYFGVLNERSQLLSELRATHLATLKTLATAIEAKDPVTHGHVLRVQQVSERLGMRLGLEGEALESLKIAALLHDIGKLAIPEYLLYLPDERSPEERRRFQTHAELGAEILEHSRLSLDVKKYVRHHHERFDGSGYPHGLAGDEIPFGARILAVVDAYDKLRFPREGVPRTLEDAFLLLQDEEGVSLDPAIVGALRQERDYLSSCSGLLESGTSTLADNILNASFVEDFHSSHREARAYYTLARSVSNVQDIDDVFSAFTDAIAQIVPFEGVRIFLNERSTHQLELAYSRGASQLDVRSWPTERWFMRLYAGLEVGPQFYPRSLQASAPELEPAGPPVQMALFALPLRSGDRGVLVLYPPTGVTYAEDECRVISELIDQAVPAIASARDYEGFVRESMTDALTGIANGRQLHQRGPNLIVEGILSGRSGCVVMIDLNGFKEVNDILGHQQGDRLLVDVARLLSSHLREGDLVARNGGDEFVLVLPDMALEAALERMQQIHMLAISLWPASLGRGVRGLSCGIAVYPMEGDSLSDLLIVADQRMYEDKRTKKAAHNARRTSPPHLHSPGLPPVSGSGVAGHPAS